MWSHPYYPDAVTWETRALGSNTYGVNLEMDLRTHEPVPAVDGHYHEPGVYLADQGKRATVP